MGKLRRFGAAVAEAIQAQPKPHRIAFNFVAAGWGYSFLALIVFAIARLGLEQIGGAAAFVDKIATLAVAVWLYFATAVGLAIFVVAVGQRGWVARPFTELVAPVAILLFGLGPWVAGGVAVFDWFNARVIEHRAAASREEPFDIAVKDRTVFVFGSIGQPMAAAFEEALSRHPDLERIVIDSPGGNSGAAMDMRDLIEARGLTVRVETLCASACLTVFAGGAIREAGAYADFECHRAKNLGILAIESDGIVTWIDQPAVAKARRAAARATYNVRDADLVSFAKGTASAKALKRIELADDRASGRRDLVIRSCGRTPASTTLQLSPDELMTIGLATHVQRQPGGAYEPAGSGDWFMKSPLASGEGTYLYRGLFLGSLTHAARLDDGRVWRTQMPSSWAWTNRAELADMLGVVAPEPLCISQQAFDNLYRKSREYVVEAACNQTPENAESLPTIRDLVSSMPQAEPCPTSGYVANDVTLHVFACGL